MKNLFKALAGFQQEVPVIHKGTQGYGYSYADLPAIFEIINPVLKKHGLGFAQPIEGNSIKTIIFHIESGATLESVTEIPQGVQLSKMNEFQVLGSAITYIRRYALSSILGLVTDKDTDASGLQVKSPVRPSVKKNSEPVMWLNEGSEQWQRLKDSLKLGQEFTLEQVKKKYKMSNQTAEKLKTLGVS